MLLIQPELNTNNNNNMMVCVCEISDEFGTTEFDIILILLGEIFVKK